MKYFYFLLSLFIGLVVNAQTNLNFETGDFTGWTCIKGKSTGVGTYTITPTWGSGPGGYGYANPWSWNKASSAVKYGVDQNQHQIVSSGTDACGNFPKVKPGGKFSALLGDAYKAVGVNPQNEEQSTIYNKFVVAPNAKYIVYNFACVIQNAGHVANPSLQPFFEAKVVLASDSETVIPCSYFRFSPGSTYGGSYPSGKVSTCYFDNKTEVYVPWTSRVIDLSAFVGQTVMLVFTVSDCGETGHYAQAYVDAESVATYPFEETIHVCQPPVKLETPMVATSSGGSPVYSWSTGSAIPFINVSTAGSYTITTTSNAAVDKGCIQKKVFHVNIFKGSASGFTYAGAPPTSLSSFYDTSLPSVVSWHWDFGDGDSSSLQNPTHTYLTMGNYNVCLTVKDSLGCVDSSCAVVNINSTTGLNSINNEPVKIYPNPSHTGEFTLSVGSAFDRYRIVNTFGVLIAEETSVLKSTLNINLNKYAPGVYYLQVFGSSGLSLFKKLVYTKEE